MLEIYQFILHNHSRDTVEPQSNVYLCKEVLIFIAPVVVEYMERILM